MVIVRSWIQTARPDGLPESSQFEVIERELVTPENGALLENIYLSVDPYMRQMMDGGWPLHTPLGQGRALGRVVATDSAQFPVGTLVFHNDGLSTHAAVLAGQPGVRALDPVDGIPLSNYLSVLGGTGMTAYVGVREILRLQAGETIYISAAAGVVGSVAGQISRVLGAKRVIGSAGSAAKVRHIVEDLGFDAAFDYHDAPVARQLALAAPEGLDATLDGVGGDHLDAAIAASREFGRIAWVGAVSYYNNYPDLEYSGDSGNAGAEADGAGHLPPAPRNFYAIQYNSLTLRGYMVRHHMHLREQAEAWMIPLLRSGDLKADEHVTVGFENTITALLGVLRGDNVGKAIVQIGDV